MFEAALTEVEQLYIIEILRWLHTSGIRVARNLVGILVQDYCRQMKSQMGARNFRSSDGCRPSKDWITNFMRRWALELAFMEAYKGSSSDPSTVARARQLIHRNHLFDPDDWHLDASSSASSNSSAKASSPSSTALHAQISASPGHGEIKPAAASNPNLSSSTASTSSYTLHPSKSSAAQSASTAADAASPSPSKKPRMESDCIPKARRECRMSHVVCFVRCADKLLVTLAPNLPPAQQLYRANMRPKYGPSPQWAAKNSKLSLGEQRFIIRVFNYLSENGVPTTKKLISLVISQYLQALGEPRFTASQGSTYRPSRNWVDMFLRTWERELHFEPWTVLARATLQRALTLLRQSRLFEFDGDERERPEPPPGHLLRARARFGQLRADAQGSGYAAEAEGDDEAHDNFEVEGDADANGDCDQDDGDCYGDAGLELDEDSVLEDDYEDEEVADEDVRGDEEEDELANVYGDGGPVTIEARFEDQDDDGVAFTPVFTITPSTFKSPLLAATPKIPPPSSIIVKRSPVMISSQK